MKKGFTLIELLAVIVILAVIITITMPIVSDMVNDSKEKAALVSAEIYLKAVDQSIKNAMLLELNIENGIYSIMNDGDLCLGTLDDNTCSGGILEVEANGKTPSSGTVTIKNEKIMDVQLTLNDNIIIKNTNGELVLLRDSGIMLYTNEWEKLDYGYDFYGAASNIWSDGENTYYSATNYSNKNDHYVLDKKTGEWKPKTWNGLTNFFGYYIWDDGENTYYSSGTTQYVLVKDTSTWEPKTWNGLTRFWATDIWSDGKNTYYSQYSQQYVLNKETSTWEPKTWSGLSNIKAAMGIWNDGENTYYSSGTTQYVLNKETSTWELKTWNGLTNFDCNHVWSDGENIYYSKLQVKTPYITEYIVSHYVLNKGTDTWETKEWNGFNVFNGGDIWNDVTNIYYSGGRGQYVLDKSTSTWKIKKWNDENIIRFTKDIWTDKKNTYYSHYGINYELDKSAKVWKDKKWGNVTAFLGSDIWNTKTNTYYQEDFLIGTDAPSKLYSLNSNVWKLIVDNTSTYDTSLNSCNPGSIWTDGENTYCNFTDFYMCSSYVLDETTNTWINKQFKDANGNDLSCLVEFASENWTDGKNTYISTSNTSLQSRHYILKNGVLESVTWNGYTDFVGSDIWSDGTNMYISSGDKQYVLNKATDTWSPKTWVGIDAFDAANIWSDGSNIYYVGGTWGNEQYRLKIMD